MSPISPASVPEDLAKCSGPDLVVTEEKNPLEAYAVRICWFVTVTVARGNMSKLCGPAVPLVLTTVWKFHQQAVTRSADNTAFATFVAPSHKRERASGMLQSTNS